MPDDGLDSLQLAQKLDVACGDLAVLFVELVRKGFALDLPDLLNL